MPELPQSRVNAKLVTCAKVIEFNVLFERAHRKLYPDNVKYNNMM